MDVKQPFNQPSTSSFSVTYTVTSGPFSSVFGDPAQLISASRSMVKRVDLIMALKWFCFTEVMIASFSISSAIMARESANDLSLLSLLLLLLLSVVELGSGFCVLSTARVASMRMLLLLTDDDDVMMMSMTTTTTTTTMMMIGDGDNDDGNTNDSDAALLEMNHV